MTAPTHRTFAIGWVLIGNILLYCNNLTQIDYYLSMIVMLQIGKYGALFPDVDHLWKNVKEKTAPNWVINKLIHATGGKHRSWQTHSLDICLAVMVISYLLPGILYTKGIITTVNREVLSIILISFSLGWLSHLFSDMLTSAGVRIVCWSKRKIALVPKQLLGLRFNTGNEWESFIYRLNHTINILLGLFALSFPFIQQYMG